jgi:hypothetical protein
MTPEQRRRSRNTGIALAIFVIAVLVLSFVRGGAILD